MMKKSNEDEKDLKAYSAASADHRLDEEVIEQTESTDVDDGGGGVDEAVTMNEMTTLPMSTKNRRRGGAAGPGAFAVPGINPSPASLDAGLQGMEDAVVVPADGRNLAVANLVDEDEENHINDERAQAVEFDPDAKPATTPFYCTRRFHVLALLVLFVIAATAIGTTVGVVVGRKVDVYTPTAAPTHFRETIGIQAQIEQVVGSKVLEDPGSAYSKALSWIIHDDPMQVPPESPNLIQRYIAAYFYIATTVDGPWLSCNPPDDPWSGFTLCYFQELFHLNPPTYHERPSNKWLSNITECAWGGVYCDEQGQILMLNLAGNKLSGEFPEGIYHLPLVRSIILFQCDLRGALPAKLVGMKNMIEIELSHNAFSGSIPAEWWQAKNLQRLDVGHNVLTGTIPTDVGNLHDITHLLLYENRMHGVIPEEVGDLESLVFFDVSGNFQFDGTIPESIGNLKNLTHLWLQRNQISGTIPGSIGELTSLKQLRLYGNPLQGELPDEIYSLGSLQELDLYECNFTGTISPLIGNYGGYLYSLRISSNHFQGTLPVTIANLTELQYIWLHDNDFSGTVPQEFCDLESEMVVEELTADCAKDENGIEEISCPSGCCSKCCKADGTDCFETSSGV